MDTEIRERLAERDRRLAAMRRRHTKEYYVRLAEAKAKGTKVAWAPAGFFSPLLDALDIMSFSPENYSCICASKQMAGRFCDAAEQRGISPTVCSYGLCAMGMMWEEDGPYGALPAADIVVHDATLCDAYAKMGEIPAQHYGVPSFSVDGSFCLDGRVNQRDVSYRVSQLHGLVRFCEEHFGTKFDYDRFKENMRVEGQVRSLFAEITNLRKEIPCPRSTRDTASDVSHLVIFPYSNEGIEYFTLLLENCRERVKYKVGVVENERFRLYYDNIPLWFWLSFYDYLQERGAVFAADCYTILGANGYYTQGGSFDPERPFESLALRHMYAHPCFGVEFNLDRCARLIQEWRCDGAVVFANRSCKLVTAGRFDKSRLIGSRFGIPILEFEGEMANPSSIDKAEVLARADLLLERLEARAAGSVASAT